MSVAKLNVEIGATIRGLTQGLKQAERELRVSGQRLSQLGGDLAVAISAPLAAFGASAIVAAGDLESLQKALETTMKTGGRSIEDAAKELELLRQAAMAPGLDFEQAVRGSVRLQNVGFSAEKAREILVQLANAVAMSGGSAQELDGVTRQFGQMIAKGRVLQEDLSIIQENMPAISQAMEKAFGTRSAERLREMGVSAEQFVNGITAQLATLPRVEGGIKNAIVNTGSALKKFLADIGMEINKAFNLGKMADDFSAWLKEVSDWFKNLDDGVKRTVVQVGLFVVALGPAVKLLGLMRGTAAAFAGGLMEILAVSKSAIGGFLGLTEALGSVRRAIALIGGGVALAAIVAIAGAVYLFSDRLDAAAFAAKKFAEAQKAITTETAKETGALNANFAVLKDETASRGDKQKAIAALMAQYPEYLQGLDLEKMSVQQLTGLQSKLNNEILRGVVERQKAAAITAIYEKQAQVLLRLQQLREGGKATAGEATLIDTGDMVRAGGIVEAVIKKMEQQVADLGTQATKTAGEFDRAFGGQAAARRYTPLKLTGQAVEEGVTAPVQRLAAATGPASKKVDALKEAMADWSNVMNHGVAMGLETFNDKADKAQDIINRLIDAGFDPMHESIVRIQNDLMKLGGLDKPLQSLTPIASTTGPAAPLVSQEAGGPPPVADWMKDATLGMEQYLSMSQQIGAVNMQLQSGAIGIGEAFQQAGAIIATTGTLIQQTVMSAAAAMAEYSAQGGASLAEFAKAALGSAAKVVRAYIQQGVAAAVFKALSGLPFPFNIAAAAAAGGLAATLFNKLISSIGIPALAQGGITTGPQLAMVGDNPGGREAIIPLDRLNKMFAGPDSGGGELTARITDDGLLFVLERAQRRSKRTRGF